MTVPPLPLHTSIRYIHDDLFCDEVPIADIVAQTGTPAYLYSLKRILEKLAMVRAAFPDAHIHFSAKSNSNLALLRTLINAGAGIDAVSGAEIYRALHAGALPQNVVFAGVGKTNAELEYALEQDIGWFNIENEAEVERLNTLARGQGRIARAALRLNPDVAANTIAHIATGHKGAKFGMSAETVRNLLDRAATFSHIRFEGLHIHIGSQLRDTDGTRAAVQVVRDLAAEYPFIRTLNIGGGLPVAYTAADTNLPTPADFADAVLPLVDGYDLILEPGRYLVADAGLLVAEVVYVKQQDGETVIVLDTGMNDLLRPALYHAHHEIVPLQKRAGAVKQVQVVGPICESTDVLAREAWLPPLQTGDKVALLTTGAYGFVMASNYNARPRPPEIVVNEDGKGWRVARRRETWADLMQLEE